MYRRKLVDQLVERMKERRKFIQIVVGPRQTGKTTAVDIAIKELHMPVHYISADDPNFLSIEWLRNEWNQARTLSRKQEALLVIDEVQKVSEWSSIVKLLWDEDSRSKTDLKVILTGSSTLLIQKGLTESLMGRFEVLYSQHWSYKECKEAFGYSLDDFLFFGGYPGAESLIRDEQRWARYIGSSIVEPSISLDILQMEEVRKPALLRALFMLGTRYSSQELSFTKMLGQLQDAGNTVTLAHYLDLLTKANLLTGLQNFSNKEIRVRKSSPRFAVFDTSLLTYSTGSDRKRLLENPIDKGHLVESAVGAYLLSRSITDGFELYWWRDGGMEVDYVIKSGEKITAIEVKSGKIKKVGGSIEFIKRYPEALSLVVGSTNCSLEDFLLGDVELWNR